MEDKQCNVDDYNSLQEIFKYLDVFMQQKYPVSEVPYALQKIDE